MSNFVVRTLSGIVYVALVMLACFTGPYAQLALAGIFSVFAVIEWMQFGKNKTLGLSTILVICAIFLSIYTFSGIFEIAFIPLQIYKALLVLIVASILISQSFHSNSIRERLFNSTFPLIYIGFPLMLLPIMPNYQGQDQPWVLASVFVLIWCNDTFAYLVGSQLGKHKLFPRISPNKTWEGFFGGVVFTLLASAVFFYFQPYMPLSAWLGLALVVLIFATLGDLFESSLKRSYNKKDSGKFMPGHGGILDRIDSLLFVLPMAYFYLRICENLH